MATIRDGHADSWVAAWCATASRLDGEARGRCDSGHARSAPMAFLRGAKYYETATYGAHGAGGVERFDEIWEQYRTAWDGFVELSGRLSSCIPCCNSRPHNSRLSPSPSRANRSATRASSSWVIA